jgi:MATE family multidrug resistance protein
LLIIAKPVLMPLSLSLLGAEAEVLAAATIYADIRYWTAPGVMLNLALIGYLVGRRQMHAVLIFEVAYNLINIGLGLLFVLVLDFGIAGIGWSSFIAEYAKLLAVGVFVYFGLRETGGFTGVDLSKTVVWEKLSPFLSVNRDLFLRTLVLTMALAAITRLSAERGPEVLAANGIIYQLFMFTALVLDGFENSAQVLNGERLGAQDRRGFTDYVRAILLRGLGAAAIVALGFVFLAYPILESFAATDAVAEEAKAMAMWLVIIPFAGVTSFIFDGVFVGASWTRAMLISMLGATAVYSASLWLTWPLGNHGLWFSFIIFLLVRAGLQAALMPRLLRSSFGNSSTN